MNLAAGPTNSLLDVAGLTVGHATLTDPGWLTGTTVVLAPDDGAVAGVDVRGGGPGTRETDLLDPRNLVERVHAVCLGGGSAFGLAAADGVMAGLFEAGVGLDMGAPGQVVPIVPAAVVFDLGRGGEFSHHPGADTGRSAYAAARAARETPLEPLPIGCVGAGTGAKVGGFKGGVGTASVVLADGTTVAALVVVNALGDPLDPHTGELYARRFLLPADLALADLEGQAGQTRSGGLGVPSPAEVAAARAAAEQAPAPVVGRPGMATTIGVVATDATLTKAQCAKLAGIAHDGLARAVDPVHTMFDGDTFFALSTTARPAPDPVALHALLGAAGDCVTRAIGVAVLATRSVTTPAGRWRSYREAFPSAFAGT